MQKLDLSDLIAQNSRLSQKFNHDETVELVEVASLLEQLLFKLQNAQLPASHKHTVKMESGNIILE